MCTHGNASTHLEPVLPGGPARARREGADVTQMSPEQQRGGSGAGRSTHEVSPLPRVQVNGLDRILDTVSSQDTHVRTLTLPEMDEDHRVHTSCKFPVT